MVGNTQVPRPTRRSCKVSIDTCRVCILRDKLREAEAGEVAHPSKYGLQGTPLYSIHIFPPHSPYTHARILACARVVFEYGPYYSHTSCKNM
jgi:hypothetical protein